MSRCISSQGEYSEHELVEHRCERCRVWECPKCSECEPYPLDGDDHEYVVQIVTRIYPAPSIPNPLMVNPWAALTDEQIAESIISCRARADAAEHTARSLERELIRRHPDSPDSESQSVPGSGD